MGFDQRNSEVSCSLSLLGLSWQERTERPIDLGEASCPADPNGCRTKQDTSGSLIKIDGKRVSPPKRWWRVLLRGGSLIHQVRNL